MLSEAGRSRSWRRRASSALASGSLLRRLSDAALRVFQLSYHCVYLLAKLGTRSAQMVKPATISAALPPAAAGAAVGAAPAGEAPALGAASAGATGLGEGERTVLCFA